MNALDTFFRELLGRPVFQRLGWALLHFLWQGLIVAVLLAVALRLLRRSSASVRYVLACAALGLLAALPVLTTWLMPVPGQAAIPGAIAREPVPVTAAAEPRRQDDAAVPLRRPMVGATQTAGMTPEPVAPSSWSRRLDELFMPALPYVVGAWGVGVLALSLWRSAGLARVRQLKTRQTEPVGECLTETFAALARRLGVSRPVRLMRSGLVKVPAVVGWLKPVLLLPASALSGLSPEQLRAVLAHELAHVRRHDYLVNLAQATVETLQFYHPAVWWVSGRIRAERENCCDDVAAAACGGELIYARALLSVEELKHAPVGLAVAVTGGGSLIHRIGRLLGGGGEQASGHGRWLSGAIMVTVLAVLAVGIGIGVSRADDNASSADAANREALDSAEMAKRPAWWRRFHEVYSLKDHELLRRIAPPFIPEREQYYLQMHRGRAQAVPESPDYFAFHWDGRLRNWGLGFTGAKRPLRAVLRHSLGMKAYEFEGPKDLLEIQLPGDWVVRRGASQAAKLAALERIIREGTGRDIRFQMREVVREVLVARGRYLFHRQAGAHPERGVHVYAEILDPDEASGSGFGDPAKFFKRLADRLNVRIVGLTKPHDGWVSWYFHHDSYHMRMGQRRQELTQKVLDNVSRQTSLRFSWERRKVPVWFVLSGDVTSPAPDTRVGAADRDAEAVLGRHERHRGHRPALNDATPGRARAVQGRAEAKFISVSAGMDEPLPRGLAGRMGDESESAPGAESPGWTRNLAIRHSARHEQPAARGGETVCA